MKRHTPSVPGDALTQREAEVLSVLAEDISIAEACSELAISRSTLNGHFKELLVKTGRKTRVGLVIAYFDEYEI